MSLTTTSTCLVLLSYTCSSLSFKLKWCKSASLLPADFISFPNRNDPDDDDRCIWFAWNVLFRMHQWRKLQFVWRKSVFFCFAVHSPELRTASYLNLKVKFLTMDMIFIVCGEKNITIIEHKFQRNSHFPNYEADFFPEIDLKEIIRVLLVSLTRKRHLLSCADTDNRIILG